jgi:hypothetical protein
MKRGEPVLDREHAELAFRAVAQLDCVRKAMAPVTLVLLLLVVAVLVAGVLLGSSILTVLGGFGLGAGGVFDLSLASNGTDIRSRAPQRGKSTGWVIHGRDDRRGDASPRPRRAGVRPGLIDVRQQASLPATGLRRVADGGVTAWLSLRRRQSPKDTSRAGLRRTGDVAVGSWEAAAGDRRAVGTCWKATARR